MKFVKKIFTFLLKIINKIIFILSKKKFKLSIVNLNKKSSFDFDEVKDLIYSPISKEYSNKILFIEKDYKTLYNIYKLFDKNLCEYVLLESEKDFENIKKIYKYKIIVVNCEFRFLDKISKKHQIVICVWHAIGAFKKVGKYNSISLKNEIQKKNYESFFDYLIVSSKSITSKYADAFNLAENKVLPLGLPQVDKYFQEDYIKLERQKFIKKYEFLKGKKIYGFFPTFQQLKHGIFWNINFKKLASMLNEDEIILFKLHPSISIEKSDFCEIKNKIIDFSFIENLISLCEFKSIVTDYSSTIFEAMIFNINLVFLRNKYVELERDLWIDYEKLPGHIINFNEIQKKNSIEKIILKKMREKFENYDLYKEFYKYNIDNCNQYSSKRIADFIKDKLNNNL